MCDTFYTFHCQRFISKRFPSSLLKAFLLVSRYKLPLQPQCKSDVCLNAVRADPWVAKWCPGTTSCDLTYRILTVHPTFICKDYQNNVSHD